MNRVVDSARTSLRNRLLPVEIHEGSAGRALFVGFEPRAASIAGFFCGTDQTSRRNGRIWRGSAVRRLPRNARGGGLSVLRLSEWDDRFDGILPRAIEVPDLVDIHTELPADVETLREQLTTSTTKEDFRRIRKAGFTYHVTTDPGDMVEFHERHYIPMVEAQFPEDGRVKPKDRLMSQVRQGGELVCADLNGEWVAGMFNIPQADHYALMTLGIRDGDDEIRNKRVVSALMIRSLERAVELGHERATLGRSLPFLGKGPVWFKAKWNGVISHDPSTDHLQVLLDLRHEAGRQMLATTPIAHVQNGALVASAWLDPGDKALTRIIRESGRFSGIARWHVLGEPETLASAAGGLAEGEVIVPVPVEPRGRDPIWLGEVLANGQRD